MPNKKRQLAEPPHLFTLEPESSPQETPARSSFKDGDQLVEQLMYSITAPFIGYPGWGDAPQFWEPHKTRGMTERLLHHQEIHRDKVASEYETMLYLSSASLAAPMSHDWGQVYFYLFARCMPEQSKVIGDEVTELHSGQRDALARLQRWIYNQQMQHLKAKRKGAGKEEKAPAPEVLEHPRLF